MSATAWAKATGGPAAMFGAAVGNALGRPVTGLSAAAANTRVATSDATVGFMTPPPSESDGVREALPGTPDGWMALGLVLTEAAVCGPESDDVALLEDTLRRVCGAAVARGKARVWGTLLAPPAALTEVIQAAVSGQATASCASALPDAGLLCSALVLGAAGVELPRSLVVLRAVARHPIALCAAATTAELTRLCVLQQATPETLVKAARDVEERVYGALKTLPGTLGGPPEMGHGAMAMSLARAQSAASGVDALLTLSLDATQAPEVVLCSVLGALLAEPNKVSQHVAHALRHGGPAHVGAALLLGLAGAMEGLKVVPLAWLGALREAAPLLEWAEAVCSGKKKNTRLAFPAADLAASWANAEIPWRQERDIARRTAPPSTPAKQMGLFE